MVESVYDQYRPSATAWDGGSPTPSLHLHLGTVRAKTGLWAVGETRPTPIMGGFANASRTKSAAAVALLATISV